MKQFFLLSVLCIAAGFCAPPPLFTNKTNATNENDNDNNRVAFACGRPAEIYEPSLEIVDGQIQGLARGIVGGNEAVEHSYPWQAYVWITTNSSGDEGFFCGGSLIGRGWVLTAAHCLVEDGRMLIETPKDVSVYLGGHIHDYEEDEVVVYVEKVITHPKYNDTGENNTGFDVALLKLEQPVTYSEQIRPVCLADENTDVHKDDGKVVVSGWGLTAEEETGGDYSDVLKQAVLTLSWQKCLEAYGEELTDNELCAAAPGRDSCQGDSGGPLIIYQPELGGFALLGVVSWGDGCAHEEAPGVYASVPYFRRWIKQHTGI